MDKSMLQIRHNNDVGNETRPAIHGTPLPPSAGLCGSCAFALGAKKQNLTLQLGNLVVQTFLRQSQGAVIVAIPASIAAVS